MARLLYFLVFLIPFSLLGQINKDYLLCHGEKDLWLLQKIRKNTA